MWYYQYDALGRRIAKACPQQQLKITYLWDGDQLAYTQTVKQDKQISQRHNVFHGWQLIAQQDRYQQSQQTLDGNKTEWKDEKRSLWGLLLPNAYRKTSPLDPQLLFAGQYSDQESGLAYNRFRYYDPESGNYISSAPIGLNGGERPFGYVGNPLDWVQPLGVAACPTLVRDDLDRITEARVTVTKEMIGTGTLANKSARDYAKSLGLPTDMQDIFWLKC
ncbi:RHS repeat-associated core domain-containing protein [Pasteurella sp. 22655_41Tandhals]|uniref:RHS repeat-associated core domain-containing protein n=1 Tax=Pasteurella sp. 22655_41Tandhals TaxID=3416655 RepID=UPI003CF0716C